MFKKQLSFVYLLISLLYLAAIFNFSLYLQLHNQLSGQAIADLSSQQVANQRLADKRFDELSLRLSDGNLVRRLALNKLHVLDQLSVSRQNKNEPNAEKARFKRSHQFDLADFDLGRVWSSEDERLKQKLINNYRPDDDENRSPVRRTKKVRSANEDKLDPPSERPTLHPPPAAPPQTRSARHRSHHQKRRLSTTTEQSVDQDQQSAEFFSQPQPNTGHANGKVWVNSYSRIPVGHVCFNRLSGALPTFATFSCPVFATNFATKERL